MTLHNSIQYEAGKLNVDGVQLTELAEKFGTPLYIYSQRRILNNYTTIRNAFEAFQAHIHYSAKANGNLSILRTLIEVGAGIDTVSAGEIYRALQAGAEPQNIVFAGVGKSPDELNYAVTQGVGWFNVENVAELEQLNAIGQSQKKQIRIALRLNPDITANTHPYIATGHGGAKFGLTTDSIRDILRSQAHYPAIQFAGIHVHIGSQLGDTQATTKAVEVTLELIAAYENIRTINIGGGIPADYGKSGDLPSAKDFANALYPLLKDYEVILEPGRSIIADAGLLLTSVLYSKKQGGQSMLITDASMSELIRPALYQAAHQIVPVVEKDTDSRERIQVVGPVCETADILGRDIPLPDVKPGQLLAILTAGAYGMVMASNYNARPRPAEVMIDLQGHCQLIRRRESWEDLIWPEKER